MPVNVRYPLVLVLKDHGPDFDLIPYLEDLEYEETGNEELSSAKITLNAHFGKFIKPVTQTGTAIPKINFFDRIYIEFTDPDGNITKDVVEVLNKSPGELPGVGDTIELNCDHQGWYFFRMHNLKQYQRESNFDMIKDQGDVYNSTDVIGVDQPTMIGHDVPFNDTTKIGNAASKATSIDMDFANSEFIMGEATQAIADRAGSSVDNGGELEFFDWRTISSYDHGLGTLLDQIKMQYRVSGDNGVSPKVVVSKNNPTIKLLDTRSSQDPEKSTAIHGWGDLNSGSLLPGFMIYFGEKEKFLAAKEWQDAIFYKAGMRVQFNGAFYAAAQDHISQNGVNDPLTGIGTFWTGPQAFVPSVDYSQLTKNRPEYWINSGAGYIHQQVFPNNHKATLHDHNLVIRDKNHRRSWVDIRGSSKFDVPASMILQGGTINMYRGFRILLDSAVGALGAPFDQNGSKDRFGKSYVDAVVQHNGGIFIGSLEYLNWDVFLEAVDDLEIIVMRDGDSYVFNPCSSLNFNGVCTGARTPGWNVGYYKAIQISGLSVASFNSDSRIDCLHPYEILDGPPRPNFGTTQGVEDGIPGVDSAVRVKFNLGDDIRSAGAWLNLAFPIPRDGFAGAFTARTAGEKFINPTLDLNNKHLSSLGKRGLNQGLDAEGRGSLDYGKINKFSSFLKLINTAALNIIPPGGDFKIRIAFFDTDDNVTIKDATLSHRDNFDEISPELPFEIYRGRHGVAFTPVVELEILDIFETRNVVRISISTLDSYDKEGRYNIFNKFTALIGDTEFQIDAPHFVKPLSATTQKEPIQANKPGRNLERDPIDAPQISNFKQLESHLLSMLEIEQFKRVEFEITRPLRCDIKFGDEFTLKHPILVDDPDFGPNDEVDLICKKNIFTYKKGKGGGGFTTKSIGVKRFRT